MRVSFRQGLIRRNWQSGFSPNFLQKTSLSGATIDLIVSPDPVVMTFAHYDADYLVEEVNTVYAAWGNGQPADDPHINNGPFPPAEENQTQYLYWDLDRISGSLRRGWSLFPPVTHSVAPENPGDGQVWFDAVNTVSKVWSQGDARWHDCIRVFAATYNGANQIIPFPLGSQVGINGNFFAGHIILGKNARPLKQYNTFVTTESQLIVQQTSAETVKFDMALVYGKTVEEVPKLHLVTILPNNRVQLASSSNTTSFVGGIVTEDLAENETGLVITNGLVRNEAFSWTDEQVGKPLFCGPTGELTLNRPVAGVSQQVGFVHSYDAIYLNLFPPVRL